MTQQQVEELMTSSKSAQEWDNNCDIVKDKCGGYPDFWWSAIVQSGLADSTLSKFGESTKITISEL